MADIRNIDTQIQAPELTAPRRVNSLDDQLSEEDWRRQARRKRARADKKKTARQKKPDDSSSSSDVDILV